MELKSLTTGENMDATVYSFSYEVLGEITDMLSGRAMELDKWRDGYVKGKITAGSDAVLFTSIPYDPGWKVKVDGKRIETEKSFSAFLGIPLTAGDHEIEMRFVPEGYYLGILFSIGAILFFVLLLFMKKRWDSEDVYYIRPERTERRPERTERRPERIERRPERIEKRVEIKEDNPGESKNQESLEGKENSSNLPVGANGRSRKRGNELAPYRGNLPRGRSRSQVVEKMEVKE